MSKLIVGTNDLGTTHPEIALEWHSLKNINLTPKDVTAGSGKKVWWRCEKGHEWQATVLSRKVGSKCPYCSGIKPIIGKNDLATMHPHLVNEWHPTKNGDLKPTDVVSGSGKYVWWLCPDCGYEWKTRVVGRSKGTGCPVCSRKQVISERLSSQLIKRKSLLETDPDLVKEWHPTKNGELFPENVLPYSSKKVWWKCAKGHEWQATIANRIQGKGCPTCAKELQTSFPEQAIFYYLNQVTEAENRKELFGKELDIYLSEFKIGVEYNGRFYHSKKNDMDKNKIAFFRDKGIRVVSINEGYENHICDDFIEYHYSSTNKSALNWAIVSLFQILQLPLININVDDDASDIYEQFIFSEKERSFANEFPELVKEWHPTKNGDLKPEQLYSSSGKKVWWMCSKCGHEWQARVADVSSGRGCYVCGRKKLLKNRTKNQLENRGTLEQREPKLAKEWHPTKNGELQPNGITCGSGKKVWWICSKGHEWQAIVKSRVNGTGCPICSGKIVQAGYNDLATVHPKVITEWNWEMNRDISPQYVSPNSNKKVWWKCNKCGHEWQAVIANRAKGHGCPVCARREVWRKRKNQFDDNEFE